MENIQNRNRHGFSQRQIDLIKTARANLVGIIEGVDKPNASSQTWKEVNDIVEMIEKLLGY